MKVNKIKNRGRTGAKVLLFCILAVTLGLSMGCRSGGDDDSITDAEAVQRAKDALRIGYAEGDRADSVTQDVTLSTTGENGVAISWESGNRAVIAVPPPPPPNSEPITGTVTRPDDANTEVTLTATLTKNDARDERTFILTVILLEDAPAVQQAKSALMIIYATGDSAESVTQDVMLPASGANGVAISWMSSNTARVSTTGTVNRPDDMDTEVILTATLTKNTTRDTRMFTLTVTLPCGTTDEIVAKLSAMPPSLSSCSAVGIRGTDMPALVSAGATKEQLLAVWSANADTGFTSAQLKAAGVTVAEMRAASLTILQIYTGGVSIADLIGAGLTITQLDTGGVPDHAIFNEACGTPQQAERETDNHPTITLTTLTATDTQVVLTANTSVSANWLSNELLGMGVITINTAAREVARGDVRGRYVSDDGGTLISTLSIPLADVFSNPTVSVADNQLRTTSIQLCPGT